MWKCSLAFIGVLLISLSQANASEIGRATIDGKTVVVDSDGTWKYAEDKVATVEGCEPAQTLTSQKIPLAFCVKRPWVIKPIQQGSFEFQMSKADTGAFAGLITEKTEMTPELAEYAILTFAAQAMNKTTNDVVVKKRVKVTLGGTEWNYIEFLATLKGTDFIFGDYYKTLGADGTAQFMVWSSDKFFEGNRSAFEELASGMRIAQ